MSYFLDNVRRLARDLRSGPVSAVPGRLAGVAVPKLARLCEEAAHRTGTGGLLARRYRGKGIALMFHEIHADVDLELRTGCSPAQLARTIEAVRAEGRDIVTIEEGLRRLAEPDSRPFAVLTFDDGYRDNRTLALPILEKAGAPMTVFVPTGMMTRELHAWWIALREVVKGRDVVDIPPMERRFHCSDLASKAALLREVTAWIGSDNARARALAPTFAHYAVDLPALVASCALDEEELKAFARHPLVAIGAHTVSHRFLSGLGDAEVAAEFGDNKHYLENLLQQPVSYLAYPHGDEGACGAREAQLAAEAGFAASFTTRPGHLFAAHLAHSHLLPRMDAGYAHQSPAALASRLNGLHRIMAAGLADPVATLS